MNGLSPVCYAVKIGKISLRAGNLDALRTANLEIHSLWDLISDFQLQVSRKLGAGTELDESESLATLVAETLGEIDALVNHEVYYKCNLKEAVAELENGLRVKCRI